MKCIYFNCLQQLHLYHHQHRYFLPLTKPMLKKKIIKITKISTKFKKQKHTWTILSSAAEAITQLSLGFQLKSVIFDVWPPWINNNYEKKIKNLKCFYFLDKINSNKSEKITSGGPSSASSGVCSAPIRATSLYLSIKYKIYNE